MTHTPDHPSNAGLGRHPDFDKRSRNFPIRQLLPGWCRVTFADMEYLLEQDGEVCVPSTRRSEDFE